MTDYKYCSFCGNSSEEHTIVAGPSVFICTGCVALAIQTVGEQNTRKTDEVIELKKLVASCYEVIEDLSKGLRHIALDDYQRYNETLIAAAPIHSAVKDKAPIER